MANSTRIVSPAPGERCVRDANGQVLTVPADWVLVPPGDATLTRRIKAAGQSWTVQETRGRKTFSRGVWAPAAIVNRIRSGLAAQRATPEYAQKREAAARRRREKQAAYVAAFNDAVLAFLAFHPRHANLAARLAQAITAHATPVGSGTVARTQRIPLADRAEAAVIAWMRHNTTDYDRMHIPRERGRRRQVRQRLAEQSRQLLDANRAGRSIDPGTCPLQRALAKPILAAG
jgi:hypothetical protein